jgi:DNA-binding NarL/FixJ family response regulator
MKAMINSVDSTLSSAIAQGQAAVPARAAETSRPQAQAVQAQAVQAQASSEQAAAVSVELSTQAQAKELKTEGYSVTEIALKLKLDEKTIDSYLNLQA